jgi:hypothetical protein
MGVEPGICPADLCCKDVVVAWYTYVGERSSSWSEGGWTYCCGYVKDACCGIALALWDMDEVGLVWFVGKLICSILAKIVPTNASHVGKTLAVK